MALRRTLLISLDDLVAVVQEFLNPINVSRSGPGPVPADGFGVGNLREPKANSPMPKHSGFKAYQPGYLHMDMKYLPQMADQGRCLYFFVAIDRATRRVFIRVFNAKTAANAWRFLRDLERACPIRIRTILTDNGKAFTDRLFGLPPVSINSISSVQPSTLSTASHHQSLPGQMAGVRLQRSYRGCAPKPSLPIR